jgi:DNA-binding NarL/FixJ family response regulator
MAGIPTWSGKRRARARILLVDDHPLVRERLGEVINREADLAVCAEAEDCVAAIESIKATDPHLVIIDLTLKNSDGLELIKDIHAEWPSLLMLVVSMHDESLYAERVLRAGARGYITKQQATRSILSAIRRVLAGDIFVSESMAGKILGRLNEHKISNPGEPLSSLAERELQVFELTGHGLNTREIAERLRIGVKTVETYRHRIREKLQLQHPRDLLRSAIAWTHQEKKTEL